MERPLRKEFEADGWFFVAAVPGVGPAASGEIDIRAATAAETARKLRRE
jgi:hypothetical protein